VTNATLDLVRDIEVYFEQSENTATAAVGVAIGAVVSVCIMLCLCCSTKMCISAKRGKSPVVACCKRGSSDTALEYGHDNDDDDEGYGSQAEAGGKENAPSALGTEGAYRSDSDSDYEDEGVKASREAQRHSRCASGV